MSADEEEDDMLGFNLFESQTPKIERRFDDLGGGMSLLITCLDEEPIGVQSGQLLWPAAPALSRHLITNWKTLRGGAEAAAVLEVGAGCGMVGIVAAKLGCRRAVMTDRDLGALELIQQNAVAAGVEEQCAVLPLSWHPLAKAKMVAHSAREEANGEDCSDTNADAGLAEHAAVLGLSESGGGFELVVAADVIYAVEVVSMLFGSVDALLKPATPVGEPGPAAQFLMCQSFPYDVAIEAEIDRCAALANLRREVIFDRLQQQHEDGRMEGQGVKIQAFVRVTGS
jgi:predicted nicotinamide N-methyase